MSVAYSYSCMQFYRETGLIYIALLSYLDHVAAIDHDSAVPFLSSPPSCAGRSGNSELVGRLPGEKHLMGYDALGTVRKAVKLLRDEEPDRDRAQ